MEDQHLISDILSNDLWEFHKRILQADNPDDKMSGIHKDLCGIMDNMQDHRRTMILMPRGHLKSATVTVGWSVQQVCKNPNVRILIGSENNVKAKDFLKQIRDIFELNERLHFVYGDHVRTNSRWTDDEITSNLRTSTSIKEPTVFTTGTDQTRTGAHCDIAILDDPVSHTNINTKEAREKTLKWYREIANNILDPGGTLVVIGTRWHFADIYQYILDDLADVFQVFHHQALTDKGYDENCENTACFPIILTTIIPMGYLSDKGLSSGSACMFPMITGNPSLLSAISMWSISSSKSSGAWADTPN